MANAIIAPFDSAASSKVMPRLKQGDRLTREEFERRYEAEPELKKAELLEGVVYMPSPVRQGSHSKPHFHFNGFLHRYATDTPGVEGGDNATLRLDVGNEPQPDGLLYIEPEYGGQVKLDAEDYIVGGPELIGEIAASSASHDLDVKLNVYRHCGVREYVVWRVLERAIDWFVLRHGQYERLAPSDGIYQSEVFPGLWLNVEAMLSGNMQQVAKTLQQGLDSRGHQNFVDGLASRK